MPVGNIASSIYRLGNRKFVSLSLFNNRILLTLIVFRVIISVIGLVLLIGLITDLWFRLKKPAKPTGGITFMRQFSPLLNLEKIHGIPNIGKVQDPDLSCLNAIRTLSLLWVELGHLYYFLGISIDNLIPVGRLQERFTFQFVFGGAFAVDSFFFLSGFLAYWSMAKRMSANTFKFWKSLPMIYLHRYLRITLPHVGLMLLATGLWAHIGDGPFYFQGTDAYCKSNWWINLLYLNNFIDISHQCVGWNWYLMVDMQFFIFAPFVVYLLVRKPNLGWLLAFFGLVVQVVTASVISAVYAIPLGGKPGNYEENLEATGYEEKNFENQYEYYYAKPYTRVGPYVIGLMFAHILVANRKAVDSFVRNRLLSFISWFLSFGIILALIYGTYDLYVGNALEPLWADVLYNALARSFWALALGWIVITCSTGKGGIIGDALGWKGWAIPARLSYSAYLLHPMVDLYFGQTRSVPFVFPIFFNFIHCISLAVAHSMSPI